MHQKYLIAFFTFNKFSDSHLLRILIVFYRNGSIIKLLEQNQGMIFLEQVEKSISHLILLIDENFLQSL